MVSLSGCGIPFGAGGPEGSAVSPTAPAVRDAEAKRRRPGAVVRDFELAAAPLAFELAGRQITTWAYGSSVPGKEIRVKAGEVVRARLTNHLPLPTTIHWHGIALRNDMDGVPDLTQRPIPSGGSLTYEFTAPDPGTYFFHPHVGTQLDRGLYAPLIIEDPREPGGYDTELVVVLDDWTDGFGESPDAILARLKHSGSGMNMGSMGGMAGMGHGSRLLGGDAGDVAYPLYLVNGRPPQDPARFEAKAGQRVRLRVINAGSDTAFRLAIGGHQLTVSHSDGFPVVPAVGDAVLLGMGERFDALVTLQAGVFPLVALAEGKEGAALAVIATGAGGTPAPDVRPAELQRRILVLSQLNAASAAALPQASPDRTIKLTLAGDMGRYRWTINGKTSDQGVLLPVRQGERVRLNFENRSMMFHPMHLHGHSFSVRGEGGPGPRKDTVIVPPMEQVTVDFTANNPGQWMLHCHNVYHQEAGMATTLSYRQ